MPLTISQSIDAVQTHRWAMPLDLLTMPGLSSVEVRKVVNALCADRTGYTEVGRWSGSTLAAASWSHPELICHSIDNASQFTDPLEAGEFFGMPVPDQWVSSTAADICDVMLAAYAKGHPVHLHDETCPPYVPDWRTDVFLYDGDHSEDATRTALATCLPALRPAVLLVDDWNSHDVCAGTVTGINALSDVLEVDEMHALPWWNGFALFGLRYHDDDKDGEE